MKLSCNKDSLNHAVQTVQKAVSTKHDNPILAGIYLLARNNTLELQANDYELGISCIIDANVETSGETVLSGKYLQELVKRLAGDTVEITANSNENTIKISSDSAEFNLLMMPTDEFPVLKPFVDGNTENNNIFSLTIKDVILKDLIKKTIFACGVEENRRLFTGALLAKTQQYLFMAATNTHRMALRFYNLEAETAENLNLATENTEQMLKLIIPAKILAEIARQLAAETPLDVILCWEKNQVSFAFENVYIISRLIEGDYPDYKRALPKSFSNSVLIDTIPFLAAVERVALMSRSSEYNVIRFDFTAAKIIITSNNPDVGKAYETVPCQMTGPDVVIAFNSQYILDVFKVINSTQIILSLNNSTSAAVIKPNNDDNFTYLITPVRVH